MGWTAIDAEYYPYGRVQAQIQFLVDKRDYMGCMTIIKLAGTKMNHAKLLIDRMTNNKDASKAADYIAQLGLDSDEFSTLASRLCKTTARHFLHKEGWQYAQDIFEDAPDILASVVQDLIFKKKYAEALSITRRHPALIEQVAKQDAKQFLNQQAHINQNLSQFKTLPNFLHQDSFCPTTKGQYLTLAQLGIPLKQVHWIDAQSTNHQFFLDQLNQSPAIGVDTESVVGVTKFQKRKAQDKAMPALVQIATTNNIFLLDGFNSQIPTIQTALHHYICQQQRVVVGHTLQDDLNGLWRSLGIPRSPNQDNRPRTAVDIAKVFKSMHPQERFSNLAHISKTVFGKQICKAQTLTNWRRRPLRLNQIHYAAMDALIVLRIFEKWSKDVGSHILSSYVAREQGI